MIMTQTPSNTRTYSTMPTHPDRIYCKTEKGRHEIGTRAHGLISKQRQTLILMDCAKTLGFIADAIPLEELNQTVPFLMEHGFIVLGNATPAPSLLPDVLRRKPPSSVASAETLPPSAIAPTPQLTHDTSVISDIKAFMISTSNTHLGLMGTTVISRIERCHSAEQLLAAAAFWHMALRESKTGNTVAKVHLEQVKLNLSASD
jgi:hypothetical protein